MTCKLCVIYAEQGTNRKLRVQDKFASLSETQKEALRLVGKGLSSKDISRLLPLAPTTIDIYLSRAATAIGATNRQDAARLLAEHESAPIYTASISRPEHIAATPIHGSSQGHRGWASGLTLPPLGGRDNDLSVAQRLTGIAKAGFVSMVLATAIIIVAKGVFIFMS